MEEQPSDHLIGQRIRNRIMEVVETLTDRSDKEALLHQVSGIVNVTYDTTPGNMTADQPQLGGQAASNLSLARRSTSCACKAGSVKSMRRKRCPVGPIKTCILKLFLSAFIGVSSSDLNAYGLIESTASLRGIE